MESDVYLRLVERLNEFEHVVPPVPAYIEVLKRYFTEEQAEFASTFPDGQFTLSELARKLNKDPSELKERLESMAYAGQIFVTKTPAGEKKYELSPWMVGVIEFSIVRRMDTPEENKKMIPMFEKMGEEARALIEPFLDDFDAIKDTLPSEHVRVLTLDEAIPDKSQVLPHENLIDIVTQQTSFAAMRCCCRHMAGLREEPCHIDAIPEYSCLFFGQVADYIVDYDLGKRLTKEECLNVLDICSKAGCVHNTNNFTEALQFVCNCCPDCCGFLDGVKKYGNMKSVSTSNFISVLDPETCILCGDCVEKCPVEAIAMSDDIVTVDESVCIGCGNCVTHCPTQSFSMKRISDKKPVVGERKIGMGY